MRPLSDNETPDCSIPLLYHHVHAEWCASRLFRVLCFGLSAFLRICLFACLGSLASDCLADTARLSGTIYTVDANQTQTVWPNARFDQRVNTQTQIDWDINENHRVTAILTLDWR